MIKYNVESLPNLLSLKEILENLKSPNLFQNSFGDGEVKDGFIEDSKIDMVNRKILELSLAQADQIYNSGMITENAYYEIYAELDWHYSYSKIDPQKYESRLSTNYYNNMTKARKAHLN